VVLFVLMFKFTAITTIVINSRAIFVMCYLASHAFLSYQASFLDASVVRTVIIRTRVALVCFVWFDLTGLIFFLFPCR